MAVPSVATYSVAAKAAAHGAFRDLIDGHASLPGVLRLRDAADALLAEIPLADPCGAVDGGTGQLVFDVDPVPQNNGLANGEAAYGEFCDGAGAVHLALPCYTGVSAVSGYLVMQTQTVVSGGPIRLISATVG